MAFKVINIPGTNTCSDLGPYVSIAGTTDYPINMTLRYLAGGTLKSPTLGEITFTSVLEYRWVADFADYEQYAEHENDSRFGLIEILNSRYIETMASHGIFKNHPGQRFGPVIKESDVKHYRIAFDDYGHFDVIALGLKISEVSENE